MAPRMLLNDVPVNEIENGIHLSLENAGQLIAEGEMLLNADKLSNLSQIPV